MKTTSAEHVLLMFCACSFHGNSLNNLLSYCGLVDARISASEKDLPVTVDFFLLQKKYMINLEFELKSTQHLGGYLSQ